MPVTAWFGAIAIGLMLGLLGSGGSILTVPILVYIVGHEHKAAIVESLAIVGVISLVSALFAVREKKVDRRAVFLFGIPGMAGAFVGAWASRHIPGSVQLIVFGVVMLGASIAMLRGGAREPAEGERASILAATISGVGVGLLTGVVGVGGGFLIVPALVLLCSVPMKTAVGTSLAIISMNCAVGFARGATQLPSGSEIDWKTVVVFAAIGIVGARVGGMISSRLNQRLLRKIFGVFLIGVAAYILWKEAFLK